MAERRWITVRAAAQYLSLHEKSVYRDIYEGKIPAAKINGSLRVDLKGLDANLEQDVRARAQTKDKKT
jgi:excisionase family DNA binding protein